MLEVLTPELFRQKLAGITGPQESISEKDNADIFDLAVRIVSVYAGLFGENLDRLTLWSRIGSAIESSFAKCEDDIFIFINGCLEHIQADVGKAAANSSLNSVLLQLDNCSDLQRRKLMQILEKKYFIILMHARNRWLEVKEGNVEL